MDEIRVSNVEVEMGQLRAELVSVGAELNRFRKRETAILGALHELSMCPDIPKVQYGIELNRRITSPPLNRVAIDTRTEVLAIEGWKVKGVMEAILRHIETMAEFGTQAVQSHYAINGIRDENRRLRSEDKRLRSLLDEAKKALEGLLEFYEGVFSDSKRIQARNNAISIAFKLEEEVGVISKGGL